MIQVDIYQGKKRDNLCITVQGHEMSGEEDKDLICFSVSYFIDALETAIDFFNEKGWMQRFYSRMNPGDAEIYCKPVAEKNAIVNAIFNSMCLGFFGLETDYPDKVKCIIHDKEEPWEKK